uniref:Lymphocyte antigen 86 SHEET, Glycoprotein, Immunity, Inflammatory n=1 Tax=Myoviridae sp. ctf4L13 TaxID=2825147 RepID=A0A8S5V8L4_9CAUD|nr:MAG TPA: Lymphocyte antigen 86 SHEET, Glycoprotein, Immunity, Inflammatory [Myoviridae sp. ctf4L13]
MQLRDSCLRQEACLIVFLCLAVRCNSAESHQKKKKRRRCRADRLTADFRHCGNHQRICFSHTQLQAGQTAGTTRRNL